MSLLLSDHFSLLAVFLMSSRNFSAATATSYQRSVVQRFGTWNVSVWTGSRLDTIAGCETALMAIQETHLASRPLDEVRKSLGKHHYTFHHGAPSAAVRGGDRGGSCGVAVVASPGVAVTPVRPVGAAWRKLHDMARVHAVFVPPRPDFPLGLRLFSVYAPLQPRHSERAEFNALFLDMVSILDMQVPTLL